MVIFNSSIYTNITQIPSLLNIADNFSMGSLGLGVWLMITFGALFLTSQFQTRESLIAASFISMITAFFLRYLGILAETFLWISGFLFALSIVVAWWINPPATGA